MVGIANYNITLTGDEARLNTRLYIVGKMLVRCDANKMVDHERSWWVGWPLNGCRRLGGVVRGFCLVRRGWQGLHSDSHAVKELSAVHKALGNRAVARARFTYQYNPRMGDDGCNICALARLFLSGDVD